MRSFSEYIQEDSLDTKIGILAYLFAHHKIDAKQFSDWYLSEGKKLSTEEMGRVLFENAPQAQPQQAQQQPGMMGRMWNAAKNSRVGQWAQNNPYKASMAWPAALAAAGAGGMATMGAVPLAMGATYLGKKAYDWYKNRNAQQPGQQQAQQPQADPATQQQQAQQPHDPTTQPQQAQQQQQTGQAAGQALQQLQQVKAQLSGDPKSQGWLDMIIQHLQQQGGGGNTGAAGS